jgi:hypothetical protein
MRTRFLLLAGLSLFVVAACTGTTPGWTYAPAPSPTPIPSSEPSTAPSASAGPSASAAPSDGGGGGGGGTVVEIFNGVAERTYDVPALDAGAYGFICSVHPNMAGTLTAQ